MLYGNYLKAQGFNPYKGYGEPNPKRSFVRSVLNKITVTGSIGYSNHFYSHNLDDYLVFPKNDSIFIAPNSGGGGIYTGWLNDPAPANVQLTDQDTFRISTDTTEFGFRANGAGIPLLFSLQYEIAERFRIGLGASIEFHRVSQLTPTAYNGELGRTENKFNTTFTRLFGTFGGKFYQFVDWHYYLDVMGGVINYGAGFNQQQLTKSLFFNVGVPIEKEFSEYFRLYIRPSWEFKNYSMALPGSEQVIDNRFQVLAISFGFRFNYPEIPRCPINACQTQQKHIHSGNEFRGQPFYRKQNPKIGELHPQLHRYKGNNKKKRSGGY